MTALHSEVNLKSPGLSGDLIRIFTVDGWFSDSPAHDSGCVHAFHGSFPTNQSDMNLST